MDKLRLALVGLITGVVDAVPGVSGATMLFIFGVYEETIEYSSNILYTQVPECIKDIRNLNFSSSVTKFDADNLKYMFLLVSGILVGLVCSFLILDKLIETNPSAVFGLFTGLIIGSSYIIWNSNPEIEGRENIKWMILGALISTVIVISSVNTGVSVILLLVSGFIASFGMLLPGISGSFLLLVIGKYSFVTDLVSRIFSDPSLLLGVDGIQLMSLGMGGMTGIAVNVKTVSYIMDKNRDASLSLIFGLVMGGVLAPIREYVAVSERDPLIFSIFLLASLVSTITLGYLKQR